MDTSKLADGTVYLPLIGTIVGGLIGLLGVAFTLKRNARNALLAETRKLAQERSNIISALLAELRRLNQKVIGLERAGATLDMPRLAWYIAPFHQSGTIFEKYLSQLGSLHPDTIAAVMQAYEEVRAVPAYLMRVGQAVKDPENPDFLEVDAAVARKLLESSIKYSSTAISRLERELLG